MNGHTYTVDTVRDVALDGIRAICHGRGDTRLADVVVGDCAGDSVRACHLLRRVADTGDLARLPARSRNVLKLRADRRSA